MGVSTSYDVFISYASPNLPLAEELHQQLITAGFTVWFDKARLNPGCNWHKEIAAGSHASRIVLPVLTPLWKESQWTKFETYGAEAVIPLIYAGTFEEIFTPPLTRYQGLAIDFTTSEATDWERLFASIRNLLAQTAPEKLVRLCDVRYAANPYFVGRETHLNEIHEALHQHPTALLTQGRVRAITALGGVGKTTLARQYAEKFWRCYPQIFWIDCRAGVASEFARLCDILVPGMLNSKDIPTKAAAALRELQSQADRLLIIDNAEDEASIQNWIPKAGQCRTLITSRFAGWSAAVQSFHLYVLEADPARMLLVHRGGQADFVQLPLDEQAACDELAKNLGYLPLALEQAAAYIAQQGAGFSFSDYLRIYREATAELLAVGVLGSTEYPDSVMTTWVATLEQLGPASWAILRLCAFVGTTPLPLSALLGGMPLVLDETAAITGAAVTAPGHPEFWLRSQIKPLRDYSLIEGDGQTITLHPLVQTVQRLYLAQRVGGCEPTLRRALIWLNTLFVGEPQDVRTWPILAPLASHAQAVAIHAADADIADSTARLLSNVAQLYEAKALYAEAEPLIRRALMIDEQSLGSAHPKVAIRLNNLATLLANTNRLTEAELLLRRALAIDEAANGPDCPSGAMSLHNLARMLLTANRWSEAEPLAKHVVQVFERCYGKDHPHVALALDNLARLFSATNRLSESEPLLRRALVIGESALGSDHPTVATRLNNLALLLHETNRLAEAEPLMIRVAQIYERSLGEHHPQVATACNNLAALLQSTNRLSEAEPLLRRALAIDEAAYGPNHPDVGRDLGNLAELLRNQNQFAEAEPLMRRTLMISESSYGPDHPGVALRLHNLASLLQATNQGTEAEPLMRRSLEILEHSLGPKHPSVARALNNLATLLQVTNRLAEAEPMVRRALAIDEASYGPDHPTVAIRYFNLAQLLLAMNPLDPEGTEAEPLMRRVVKIFCEFTRQTGHRHPHLLVAVENYWSLLNAMQINEADRFQRLLSTGLDLTWFEH